MKQRYSIYTKSLSIFFIIILFLTIFPMPNIESTEALSEDKTMKIKPSEFLLDLILQMLMERNDLPSLSIGIVKNNELIWSKAYGNACVFPPKKATTDTIYLISSVSKPFLATAYLQLYEEGFIDLDDPINQYLPFNLTHPFFPYPDTQITIRHLLSHRSGIYDYAIFNPIGMLKSFSGLPLFPTDLSNWLEERLIPGGNYYSSKFWRVNNPPGGGSYYSNIGYLVLACAFEQIAGQPVETYVQEHIFDPLEMQNTSYHPQTLNSDQMATLYHDKKAGFYIPLAQYDYRGFAPMCGIRTSTKDLSHFLIAHMNNGVYKENRILQNETIQLMHNTIYQSPESFTREIVKRYIHYGLGWATQQLYRTETDGHNGISPGAAAFMRINDDYDTGVILQTNKFNIFKFHRVVQYSITTEVFFLMVQILFNYAERL